MYLSNDTCLVRERSKYDFSLDQGRRQLLARTNQECKTGIKTRRRFCLFHFSRLHSITLYPSLHPFFRNLYRIACFYNRPLHWATRNSAFLPALWVSSSHSRNSLVDRCAAAAPHAHQPYLRRLGLSTDASFRHSPKHGNEFGTGSRPLNQRGGDCFARPRGPRLRGGFVEGILFFCLPILYGCFLILHFCFLSYIDGNLCPLYRCQLPPSGLRKATLYCLSSLFEPPVRLDSVVLGRINKSFSSIPFSVSLLLHVPFLLPSLFSFSFYVFSYLFFFIGPFLTFNQFVVF